jgi:hypothetical protein
VISGLIKNLTEGKQDFSAFDFCGRSSCHLEATQAKLVFDTGGPEDSADEVLAEFGFGK